MARGGKRIGAGRKPGSVSQRKFILRDAIDQIALLRGGYEKLIEGLWQLAEGVQLQHRDSKEAPIVYSKPPESAAARIILEFRFGKPSQSHEVGATIEPHFNKKIDWRLLTAEQLAKIRRNPEILYDPNFVLPTKDDDRTM